MYPLRFQPIFRQYLWGGRRLNTLLDKPIGDGDDYAESWEIVDHGEDQSVVIAGELAGMTLGQLVREMGPPLLGKHHPQERFPLLFKFLDAQKQLSVQVHPDDAGAALLDPPDLGKTEAWVILAAEPGSVIYSGLKAGMDRDSLAREVANQTTEACLHSFHPKPGDCVFLPAGIVHAIGAGLVVAEIQQASDTTFRVFDWNRVGKDGKMRELHVEQALDAIDYSAGPVVPRIPRPTEHPASENLVCCDKFIMNRWVLSGDEPVDLVLDDGMQILAVIDGAASVEGDPSGENLGLGQTMLVPAAMERVILQPRGPVTLLQIHLP